MKVLAFGNHAPDEIIQMLKNAGYSRSSIHISARRELLPKRNRYEHIIFLSFNDFKRQNVGPSYDSATFYVFDDPLRLFKVGLDGADFERSEALYLDGLTLHKLASLPQPKELELDQIVSQEDLLEMALEEVKAKKTFLNQFMSYIYLLPSGTHQKPIREAVFRWMITKEPVSKLTKRLEAIRGTSPLNEKQRLRLIDLVSSEVIDLYRLALRQDEGTEDEMAAQMNISSYELRYIRAVLKPKKR
jgi:hypothetical protein